MSKKINAVIVEDDPYFTQLFKHLLLKNGRLNISQVFHNGEGFLNKLKSGLSIDVVFLDIALPGIAGSEIGKKIRATNPDIQVVFVTGSYEYAVKAFDIDATDYLLKPFDRERVNRCIDRIINKVKHLHQETKSYKIINKKETIILDLQEIIFIEKYKKSTIFHTVNKAYKSSDTIKTAEQKLNQENFIRSHKSYLVNLEKINKVEKWGDRSYQITFNDTKSTAQLSRSKYDLFMAKIKERS